MWSFQTHETHKCILQAKRRGSSVKACGNITYHCGLKTGVNGIIIVFPNSFM